jgi:hypothetical protein
MMAFNDDFADKLLGAIGGGDGRVYAPRAFNLSSLIFSCSGVISDYLPDEVKYFVTKKVNIRWVVIYYIGSNREISFAAAVEALRRGGRAS